jgi:hypothetical protein
VLICCRSCWDVIVVGVANDDDDDDVVGLILLFSYRDDDDAAVYLNISNCGFDVTATVIQIE